MSFGICRDEAVIAKHTGAKPGMLGTGDIAVFEAPSGKFGAVCAMPDGKLVMLLDDEDPPDMARLTLFARAFVAQAMEQKDLGLPAGPADPSRN